MAVRYAGFRDRALCPPATKAYIDGMTLSDLENAVAKLAPDDLARFRAWFDEFDATRFDQKIERDANSGKLDRLAGEALEDFRSGRVSEL